MVLDSGRQNDAKRGTTTGSLVMNPRKIGNMMNVGKKMVRFSGKKPQGFDVVPTTSYKLEMIFTTHLRVY
jgi:hypothetical protein